MQNQLFINGEFVDARSGETFATINPATEETITNVAAESPVISTPCVDRLGTLSCDTSL